jgi:hypothetical protein
VSTLVEESPNVVEEGSEDGSPAPNTTGIWDKEAEVLRVRLNKRSKATKGQIMLNMIGMRKGRVCCLWKKGRMERLG